jgi:hypothetical protein
VKIRPLALAALGLLALSAAAGAYVLNGPKWGISQIPYYINPVNGDMSETDAITAIQAAAMNWTSQSNAAISLYYMGRTSGSSLTKNDRNEVFFRNASAGSTAAEVYWWYDSNYRLVEADMVFYDGGFRFFPGSSGCASGLYLEDVATHEFGHVLGLGHSSVSTATMAPSVQWCSMATRSLDGDDLAGVEALYPPGGTNTAPSVSITSPANGATVAEGTSILFAGSAADQEDGPLSGSLLWLSSRDGQIGSGASFTRVLSAGGHTITARVTDSKGVTTESRRTITVETVALPPASAFALSARGYKVKGQQRADLTWEGSSATSIDVYRNGGRIGTVANVGRYTDALNVKGGGTYSYKVCAAGSSTCSNTTTIVF